jgi:hypothetical protein
MKALKFEKLSAGANGNSSGNLLMGKEVNVFEGIYHETQLLNDVECKSATAASVDLSQGNIARKRGCELARDRRSSKPSTRTKPSRGTVAGR